MSYSSFAKLSRFKWWVMDSRGNFFFFRLFFIPKNTQETIHKKTHSNRAPGEDKKRGLIDRAPCLLG